MSRMAQWLVLAAVVEMTLVAAWVIFAKWQALPADPAAAALRKVGFVSAAMAFFPLWLSAGACLIRRMTCTGPRLRLADDTLRHSDVSLMAATALCVGVQAWAAAVMLGIVTEKALGVRLIEALTGVFVMVAGNFGAKTSPPTGEGAPDPAVWARGMLRIGWFGVAAGFVILVAAIAAPIDLMVWVVVGSIATYALATVWQGRIIHRTLA